MRHKFLGTGEAGYHPLRKIRTVFSGLRYAVLYDLVGHLQIDIVSCGANARLRCAVLGRFPADSGGDRALCWSPKFSTAR
jgi:hypothetical protein